MLFVLFHYTVFKVHSDIRSLRLRLSPRVYFVNSHPFGLDLDRKLACPVRDSFDIIALPPPFVNTFFYNFSIVFSRMLYPSFSLVSSMFFLCHSRVFKNIFSNYILKYIGDISPFFRFPSGKGNTCRRTYSHLRDTFFVV